MQTHNPAKSAPDPKLHWICEACKVKGHPGCEDVRHCECRKSHAPKRASQRTTTRY